MHTAGQNTKPLQVSIVIPVFNEAPVLEELHRRVVETCDRLGNSWEIVYVDDGSSDASGRILEKLRGETAASVRIVRLAGNHGQQAAVLAGFRHSEGDVVVQLDGDLQHPPEEIPKLLDALADAHMQLVTTTPIRRHDPPWRVTASALLRHVGGRLLGKGRRLNLSSFRAMRRNVIEKIQVAPDQRYLAVLMSRMNVPSVEIPVEHHPRSGGATKYSFFSLFKMGWILLASCLREELPAFPPTVARQKFTVVEIVPSCKSKN
jgi:undecaprenyl-phosphate 4-deoxy-4-formamido-L-arabinose transferase